MWKAKLLRGVSAFTLVWAVRFVVGLATSVVLYRYFGPHGMGVLAIASSLLGVVTFVMLETDMIVVPRLAGRPAADVKRVVLANWGLKALNKVVVAAVLAAGAAFAEAFYGISGLAALLGVLAAGQVASIAYGPAGPEVLQGLVRYRDFFWQGMAAAGSQVGAVGLTLARGEGLREYLIYTVVFDTATAVYGWWVYGRLRRMPGWQEARPGRAAFVTEARSLAVASIPVSLNQLLFKSYLYVANLLAATWYAPTVVGYLSFVSNIVNKANGSASATLSAVFLPFFSELRRKDPAQMHELYARGYHSILVLGGGATLLLAFFAREVTLTVAGAAFLPAVMLLQILALQLVFRIPLQILRMVYFAFERTWALFGVFALKTVAELACLLLLTQWFAEKGIVLAQVASYAVYAVASAWIGFGLLYGDNRLARVLEMGRDLVVLVGAAVGLILFDLAFAPGLAQKLAMTVAGLALGALWVRSGQVSGRRAYLLGR